MIAFVFPGQGSQKVGMGKELAETFSPAAEVFDAVSRSTDVDVRNLCWNLDEETLRQTENAQLALFTCGLAAARVLESDFHLRPDAVAGHSVGEFCALVVAGVYNLHDAAKLVKARGLTMARAPSGSMAAVLGLDAPVLEEICRRTSGLAAVANDNAPGQIVISGEADAVVAAGQLAVQAGAKRVIPLNVSGAFHSPLMRDSATKMRGEFDRFPTSDASIKIYSNVTGEPAMVGKAWPELLERQLFSPVRWTESVLHMSRDGVDRIVECGVGDVLSGLIRRIDRELACWKVSDTETAKAAASALMA